MTGSLAGLLCIVVFLGAMVSGIPIGFSGLLSGFVTLFVIYGDFNTVGAAVSASFISQTSAYVMTVIPLFVFMGYIAHHYGIGRDIYNAARTWLGRLPGGLAVSTVMGCAFFGAISASSSATVALFSKLAIPEMEKSKYDWRLSLGSVAAGANLDSLIPPSTFMVIYAMLAEQSVAKILIAGFIPGFTVAAVYTAMIIIRCIRNPKLGPAGPPTSLREKVASLKGLIIALIVIVIILGGLYGGVFTPTEAAAASALMMLIAGMIQQRGFHWGKLRAALEETVTSSCMIFVLLIGIKVMTTALIAAGSIKMMVDLFQSAVMPPYLLLLIAIILYMILGMVVGVMAMLVMTVPFIIPILVTAGFDPIWLGIIVVRFCGIGALTPPVAMNVFILAQITGRDVGECFKCVWWFLAMDFVTIAIFTAFPGIILFLPSRLG